jgi:hypothetical protein
MRKQKYNYYCAGDCYDDHDDDEGNASKPPSLPSMAFGIELEGNPVDKIRDSINIFIKK